MKKWELHKETDVILRQDKELNKKYPERRNKSRTYIVDLNKIENRAGCGFNGMKIHLNAFERDCYKAIAIYPSQSYIFNIDMEYFSYSLKSREKDIFNYLINGYTQVDISRILGITRKTVYNILRSIRNKWDQQRT